MPRTEDKTDGIAKDRIIFDAENVLVVDIGLVRPNDYNPKDEDTEEYMRVRESIRLKGLRMPIIVRENNGYEIIDGQQRLNACIELGYTQLLIYNAGEISDQEARELTIAYQQQVPFNEVQLAELVKELVDLGDFQLPYPPEQIENYLELLKVDFDAMNADTGKDLNISQDWIDFDIRIPKDAFPVIESEFDRIGDILELKAELTEPVKRGLILKKICANSATTPIESLT